MHPCIRRQEGFPPMQIQKIVMTSVCIWIRIWGRGGRGLLNLRMNLISSQDIASNHS